MLVVPAILGGAAPPHSPRPQSHQHGGEARGGETALTQATHRCDMKTEAQHIQNVVQYLVRAGKRLSAAP
jgi:hypothetical protein